MALFPSGGAAVKGRVLASFPSTVEGTGGIAVSKSNGVWTIEPAWDDLSVETTLADASDRQLWIYNPGTDVYTRLSVQYLLDNLPAGPSGDDGSLIFVQNSAPATDKPEGSLWVDADSTDLDLYQLVSSVWTDTTANLKGATGATGATGPAVGVQFTYSTTTTDSDPGSGIFRFNNATIASATAGYFDNNDAGGSSVSGWLDTFDDSTTTHKGYLIVRGVTTQSAWAIFSVTGSVTDGTGYRKLTLTYIAHGGTWANGETFAFGFSRTGDKGSDGAGAGDVTAASSFGTDNRIVRSDGTGKGVQSTGITVDDSDNVSGVAAMAATTIELGHASDTTISRTGAGAIAVEGVGVALNSTSLPHTASTIELGHASDTTISRTGAGAIAVEGVGVALNSTSLAHTASTVELGHASDTTLSRSAAGIVAVEGTPLLKAGKQTIWIPAAAMTARTTNGAAAGTVEMSTNKQMFKTLDFDTSTQEFAQFAIHMPKSWDESTVTFVPVWSHASTTTNFGVVWALEAVALSDDDAGDASFGTAQTSTDTGGTTNDIYIGPESSAITIGGSPAENDYVFFQVKRVPSDGSDTMAIDARLHGVKLIITTDASTDA